LDGVDIYKWEKIELGPSIGYLPQNIDIFEATIAENIGRFGDYDKDKLIIALKRVGLSEYVFNLPEGLDTLVGGNGYTLSGGQKQRLGIARAIYGSPKLIVMDEPNSNLDEEGLNLLNNIILELKNDGVTVIIMTHKRGILKNIDNLLIIKEGNLKIYGPKQKVLDKIAGIDVKSIPQREAISSGYKLGTL